MTTRRRPASAADGYDERLLALIVADTAEQILDAGAALLGELAGSPIAVALRMDASGNVLECWHPAPEAAADPHAARLRALAVASVRDNAPVASRRATDGAAVWKLSAGGRTLGAVGLLLPPRPRRGSALRPRLDRAARFVAEKLARALQATESRSESGEQDRLFRRLDRQVRVLDGERQKFAAIVNQSGTYMFVTDPSGSIRWTNRAMGMRWQPRGDGATWIGKSCRDVCSLLSTGPTPSACTSCPVARAAVHNDVMHHEFRETGDGKVRTLYLSALPIKGLDGQPQEVLVMMQDLSDLETLRESEERYRVITQAASDGIVTVGEDGVIVFANSAAERIFGYKASDLVGQPLTRLMPPALADRHRAGFSRYMRNGEKRMSWEGVQVPAIHSSGRELMIEISFGEFGASGRRLFTGVIRDITDRRRAEIELKRAQERLRMVVSKTPIVLFVIDCDGIFTLSEGRGLETLGLSPNELVGSSAFEVYRDVPRIVANLQRALGGAECVDVVDVGPLVFDTCYIPLRDEAGQVVGVIGVATDVTERRQLENQLLQSQKMEAVGRLAGGIAHDFNNLLTTVLGYSTLLLQGSRPGQEPDKRIVEIKRAAERAAGLTRQLLAFSRKQVIQPRVTDLNKVVTEMQEMLQRLIGEDIEFVFTNSAEPVLVRADPGQLEQLLMNLVVNARDAMPRGGRLDVGVAALDLATVLEHNEQQLPAGHYVALTVRDTGSGMDRETLARVFEPFYTNKERGKGTGLGLAMVHGIVQQSGGHVFVRSRVGLGTTFEIYLPRTEGPVAAEEVPPSTRHPAGAETLLLVEDEATVRELVLELLRREGYSVLVAGHGDEALAVAARHAGPIHLLVTDVVMPGMSGGELAKLFQSARPGVRVLYMSGYSDDAIVRAGVSQAGSAFLQKPFSYEGFVTKVRELLDRPALPGAADADEPRAA